MTKKARKGRVKARSTPIRAALNRDSSLQQLVKDGLNAIEVAHRGYFDQEVRSLFADSLDIDTGLKGGAEQENRWDYLLGRIHNRQIIGVEPHSAKNDEVATVINKRRAALRQLQNHLRDGASVSKWFWVASGRVQFSPMEKATFRLAQNGIEFVGRTILIKHLG